MFSYGTGGLHTLPLHLVRFLWLPALNVCSLIGERLQFPVPIQPFPQTPHSKVFMWQHQTSMLLVWCVYTDLKFSALTLIQ